MIPPTATGKIRRCAHTLRLVAAVAAVGVLAMPQHASAAAGLATGFSGDDLLTAGTSATRTVWLGRAVSEGAGALRVGIRWSDVAPGTRPVGFDPADPAASGYDWSATDAAIRDASADGLRVTALIFSAPTWAEGPDRPANVGAGSWRPDPVQFAAFARAAALRYSGTFADPLHPGRFLPQVSYWQAWNEPNLAYYLSPQWKRAGRGWAPASVDIYRSMLNAFYTAVKSVSPSNFVVMGGTAPYGDPPGYARMRPLLFYRLLFCMSASMTRTSCPHGSVHLDAVDNHPYTFNSPEHPPYYADDVTVPDVWKVGRVLHAAERAGTVLPDRSKQIWATELLWDSNPPSNIAGAVPVAVQARYLEQSMYLLWRQGVSVFMWLEIRDAAPLRHYLAHFSWGGLYYYSGVAKPAATAYRFPFVTQRLNGRRLQAWGRAPCSGLLTISRQLSSHRWVILARLNVSAEQVFVATLRERGWAALRAQVSGATSLTWNQGA